MTRILISFSLCFMAALTCYGETLPLGSVGDACGRALAARNPEPMVVERTFAVMDHNLEDVRRLVLPDLRLVGENGIMGDNFDYRGQEVDEDGGGLSVYRVRPRGMSEDVSTAMGIDIYNQTTEQSDAILIMITNGSKYVSGSVKITIKEMVSKTHPDRPYLEITETASYKLNTVNLPYNDMLLDSNDPSHLNFIEQRNRILLEAHASTFNFESLISELLSSDRG